MYPAILSLTSCLGDEASSGTDSKLPSPFTSLDPGRLPSQGMAEDNLPGLELPARQVVRRAPEGAISPTLEDLPAELRTTLLMSIPNLATLSRLVHASPVFHAQYLLDRKSILTRVFLTETTEDVFVDVYAAFRSRPSKIGPPTGPNTNVTSFLALYRIWRSPSATDRPTLETCSLDRICWMARFHQSTVNPLATYFIFWTLANFRSSPVQPNSQSPEATEVLTRTEKTRLTRALYRFEVFCHLFCGSQYERFVAMDINEVFFSDLDLAPWEAEEMNCIYAFVKQNYEAVVDDVKWDLNEENPKFDGQFEPELQGLAFPIDQDYDGKCIFSLSFPNVFFSFCPLFLEPCPFSRLTLPPILCKKDVQSCATDRMQVHHGPIF